MKVSFSLASDNTVRAFLLYDRDSIVPMSHIKYNVVKLVVTMSPAFDLYPTGTQTESLAL